MDGDPGMPLVVIGTGATLGTLFVSQLSGLRREMRGEFAGLGHSLRSEIAELRRKINSLENRVARLEGMIDPIWMGMHQPPPSSEAVEANP